MAALDKLNLLMLVHEVIFNNVLGDMLLLVSAGFDGSGSEFL